MSTGKKVIIAAAILVLAEALTFYVYSLLWLAEGQPKNHGDPRSNAWARVCIGAMLLELLLFLWPFFRWIARKGTAPDREAVR